MEGYIDVHHGSHFKLILPHFCVLWSECVSVCVRVCACVPVYVFLCVLQQCRRLLKCEIV